MAVVLSLLRGVNVGGHNKIRMDGLRALYESLGLRDPHTYLQSGNVIFRTAGQDLDLLRTRIEKGIERSFGFRVDVMLRTPSELRDVVAGNPFARKRDLEPSKLLITFLAGHPKPDARDKLLRIQADPEELRLDGRELYLYCPNGIGRSKLSPALIEKTLKTSATGRNWNTVRQLLEMAENLEGA